MAENVAMAQKGCERVLEAEKLSCTNSFADPEGKVTVKNRKSLLLRFSL